MFEQVSIISATSYESRNGAQVFARTGQYKNVLVRIKELKFNKKKDISRDSMKEMRILRDLRHDNVNSFIGAAINTDRILLVTDYCTKGSLYVSIQKLVIWGFGNWEPIGLKVFKKIGPKDSNKCNR